MPRLEEWPSSTKFGLQAHLQFFILSAPLSSSKFGVTPAEIRRISPGSPWEGIMLHLLWEAIIGLVVGALAKLIMPGRDPGGIIITMLLGIAGALLAGWLGRAVGLYQQGQGAGFLMSLLGAIILLAIYRMFKGRRATA
jgi:uncharacterized membrane protein YeaQ/YmgE (transglycosylase-associated protein family)